MEKTLRVRISEIRLVVDEGIQLNTGDELKITPAGFEADTKAKQLDAYKLEYEQTQEHYRDGYRAVWTNFSYITVAIGAIIGFGSQRNVIPLSFLVIISGGLWLFWWAATFIPLDVYGERRADVLQEIETKMNELLGGRILTHWTTLNALRRGRWWRVKRIVNIGVAVVVTATVVTFLVLRARGS